MKKIIPIIVGLTAAISANAADQKDNKYLVQNVYAMTHFNPAQNDQIPYKINKGVYNINLNDEDHVTGGPVNIITLNSTNKDYMWGVSTQGVSYIDIDDDDFEEVARFNIPGIKPITRDMYNQVLNKKYTSVSEIEKNIKEYWGINDTRLTNGIYPVVDNRNIVYSNYQGKIYAFKLKDEKHPKHGIENVAVYDVPYLAQGEGITGLSMTYDGHLIIVGNFSVGIIDRDFKNVPKFVRFGSPKSMELISNSIAVDDQDGIYVVSDKYMHKLVWNGHKLSDNESDGAWKSEYELGDMPPAIKHTTGSGSTPTLMGFGRKDDRLVVITDGRNRMNLVAFWRDEIPDDFKQKPNTKSRRIADQISVQMDLPADMKWIQSEQSVVVKDYGAFVINNVVDTQKSSILAGVIALGPITKGPRGVERFEWNPKTDMWERVWARNDVSSISMVPVLSTKSNIVLVNGFYKGSGWEVRGLDWDDGTMVHQTKFGFNNFGNGAYAILQLFKNGDLLFNSIAGPFRIKY